MPKRSTRGDGAPESPLDNIPEVTVPDSDLLPDSDDEPTTPSPSDDELPTVEPAPPPATPKPTTPFPDPKVEAYMEVSPARGLAIRTNDPEDQREMFVKAVTRNEKVSFVYRYNGVLIACIQTQAQVAQNYLRALKAGRKISV